MFLRIRNDGTIKREVDVILLKKAFSLMEILIALAILMIGMVSLLGVFGVATATHQKSIMETKCALLVSNVLEELRGDFTRVSPVFSQPFTRSLTYPDLEYAYSIHPIDASKEVYWVLIQIRWKFRGEWVGEQITTLLRPKIY